MDPVLSLVPFQVLCHRPTLLTAIDIIRKTPNESRYHVINAQRQVTQKGSSGLFYNHDFGIFIIINESLGIR